MKWHDTYISTNISISISLYVFLALGLVPDSNTVTIDTQIIERFSSAWKCGICKKVCSTKKSTITHLIDVHQMSKSKVENMAKYAK